MGEVMTRKDFLKKTFFGTIGLVALGKGALRAEAAANDNTYFYDNLETSSQDKIRQIDNTLGILTSGTVREITMSASAWEGSTAPFVYDFTQDYPSDKWNIEIGACQSTTDDMIKALSKANIVGDVDTNKCYARGTKPTTDIKVMVIATPKV